MKELSIEKKAKRYDEVVNKLRHFITQGVDPLITRADVQDFFPELAESEDEKLRKAIIDIVKSQKEQQCHIDGAVYDKMLAWLEKQGEQKDERYKYLDELLIADDMYQMSMNDEMTTDAKKKAFKAIGKLAIAKLLLFEKQGEQKPADKVGHLIPQKGVYYVCIKDYCPVVSNYSVNTKDKIYKSPRNGYINNDKGVGLSWTNSCTENYFRPVKEEDWIVCEQNNVIGKPLRYKEFMSELIQKNIKSLEDKGIVPNFRLWDIFDAKDGDVLADEDNNIGIFKECEGIYWNSYIYLGCDGTLRGFSIGGKHEQNNTRPATKEQCDLLFSKMKEAGYEWSDEDRKLIKIVK